MANTSTSERAGRPLWSTTWRTVPLAVEPSSPIPSAAAKAESQHPPIYLEAVAKRRPLDASPSLA